MLNQPKKALERHDFQETGPASQPRGQPSQPTIQTAIHTGFVGNIWCPNRRRNRSLKTQRKTNSGFGRAGEFYFRRASQLANQSANQPASQPAEQPASQPAWPASQPEWGSERRRGVCLQSNTTTGTGYRETFVGRSVPKNVIEKCTNMDLTLVRFQTKVRSKIRCVFI